MSDDVASIESVTKIRRDRTLWGAIKRSLKVSRQTPIEYAALPSYREVYLNHLIGEFNSLKAFALT
jgi:hypothetical protein